MRPRPEHSLRIPAAALLLIGATAAPLLIGSSHALAAQAATSSSARNEARSDTRTGTRASSNRSATRAPAQSDATSRRTAPGGATTGRPAQRQRELQTEQQRLQARLTQAKRQLAAAEASHTEATDALRESEAAISSANRRLRELASQRQQVERQVVALQERSRVAATRQGQEERQLGQTLRAQLVLSHQPPWQRLLVGQSPQQPAQDAAWLGYMARASTQTIGQLAERREELALLETESRDKQAELTAIARAEEDSRRQLVKQQAARRQTLDRLARQIGSQRQSVATLERDDRRLSSLIDELGKVLAEQARREQLARERERQRRAAESASAARAAAADPGRPAPARPAPRREVTPADIDPPPGGAFAQLRGKLVLPVKGEVTARFGAARRTEAGVDAPTWKGVFIRAREGSEVHAVAAGRVVFADWLRGFGNLLILDHGDGYLSVYGNNESLLASAGERVDAGAVIAAVGNTGGGAEPGLYFELRFQGRPFDPLRWAQAR